MVVELGILPALAVGNVKVFENHAISKQTKTVKPASLTVNFYVMLKIYQPASSSSLARSIKMLSNLTDASGMLVPGAKIATAPLL